MTNTPGAVAPRLFTLDELNAMQDKVLSMKTDAVLERLAILFVVNCFRNTVLETYHVAWPEFTDDKMKALMQQAVNKLHTDMHAIFAGDQATRDAAWEVLHRQLPTGWDKPEFDPSMLRMIELTKTAQKKDAQTARQPKSPARVSTPPVCP